jgi:RNA polymerase sigma-70 factor, ECF subfamily
VRETRANSRNAVTRAASPAGVREPRPHAEHEAETRVERLYEDYSGRVFRYCLSRLDSPEEAEDALQATYLNAWRSLSRGVEPISTRPWLFAIAANVCSTMLRRRLTGATVELRSPEAFDRIPSNTEPNDDLLGLSAALEELPERQRRALLLRDWRGLSYDEIAVELGASYQAVETLLFRARKSVAAGLRKPEPAGVPVRARAAAPLLLLLPFKHGISSLRSTLSASVAPIKVSLGIALGAAAPLVVYGLVERGMSHPPAVQKAAAPAVQVETTATYASPASGGEKAAPLAAPAEAKSQDKQGASSAHAAGGGAAGGAAHEQTSQNGAQSTPSPPDQASPPSSDGDGSSSSGHGSSSDPTSPPASNGGGAAQTKVTLCHHTKSKKNPFVTITVAADAVDALLAQGDTLGACAS